MKIGIVAPSPVPFGIGGAENLWWGLQDYLNQQTEHQAEIIKLPSREFSFWDLLDNYRHFSRLDLSHFDLIISGKYPSWMVQHPNHVCYMLHCLRGLYDTYHFSGLPLEPDIRVPEIALLSDFMRDHHGDPSRLEEFFQRIERLRECGAPPDNFAFPGPLIRRAVHFLDAAGLAPSRIRKYAAIARNVTRRENYFPQGCNVEVAYPPSNLRSFQTGSSEYFLVVGRLDVAKRTYLLIDAMLRSKTTIPMKIAGVGPDEALLRERSKGDPRIQFLGFVNDEAMIGLYANALAAVYAPYDEDYGLVTVEAMASGKPVVTTTDAGGPLEFVRHGMNGFVVDPNPDALAERLDYLDLHRQEALSMAPECLRTIAPITWQNVSRVLLGNPAGKSSRPGAKKKPKITVTTTFPIFPPRGGGQSRVYHLYRNLTSEFDVEIVSFCDYGQRDFDDFIAPGVREIRIPKSREHSQAEWRLVKKLDGVAASDVIMPKLYALTPRYIEALTRSSSGSVWLVLAHPYLLPAVEAVLEGQRILYEAQDVEAILKQTILPPNRMGRYFLKLTAFLEDRSCKLSSLIMTCSQEDASTLSQMYGLTSEKAIVAPNGVDLSSVTFHSWDERQTLRLRTRNFQPFTVLFMASWHGPNIEAALCVIEVARQLPHINFLFLGSVGAYLGQFDFALPVNVKSLGVIDDKAKDDVLSWVDLAINPMENGSGTNLKMLDYMAAGIPVLSTNFGARGLGIVNGIHARLAPLSDFPQQIEEIRAQQVSKTASMVERARSYVVTEYSWEVIGSNLLNHLLERNGSAHSGLADSIVRHPSRLSGLK